MLASQIHSVHELAHEKESGLSGERMPEMIAGLVVSVLTMDF